MKKPELLAPAGNFKSLVAAIKAGADAVYLGGYMFGARSFSSNFSDEEIVEAIKYSHIRGVKVYVTLNTLIYENEVEMFMNYVDFLHKNNVDAIILQDIGMMDLVRKTYPNLEIHASTQMHIHNLEGAKLLEKLGIRRAVLARETSIELLNEIKKNTNIELEIFVHGALCVSYSGQCLMSSMIGSRSGNRGTCAQPCRKKYKLYGNSFERDGYLISPKDLSTIDNIDELMNFDSLKIEGRMKRPEYVYSVVKMYRDAIDSVKTSFDKDLLEVKKLFNREFTKGFLFNEDNGNFTNEFRPNHMGILIGNVINYKDNKVTVRLTDDVSINDGLRIVSGDDVGVIINNFYINNKLAKEAYSGDEITFEIKKDVLVGSSVLKTTDAKQIEAIEREIEISKQFKINGKFEVSDKMIFTVTDSVNFVTVSSTNFSPAINKPITEDDVFKQLNKTGSSNYYFENIDIVLKDNIFINVKELNDIRRQALELLDKARIYQIPYLKKEYEIDLPDFKLEKNIDLLSYNETYKKIGDNFDNVYTDNFSDNTIRRLPRVIECHEEFNELVMVGEMGSLNFYDRFETDFSLNVTNSYAVAFLHSMGSLKVTLSLELNFDQIKDIIESYQKRYKKHPNISVVVHTYPEVMINKFNLLAKYDLKPFFYLEDEFNNKYYADEINSNMRIYSYKPKTDFEIEKYFNIGINNVRIDVTPFDTTNVLDFIKK